MVVQEAHKNIVHDQWLSQVLKRPVYKIIIDASFQKDNVKKFINEELPEKAFLYAKVAVTNIAAAQCLEGLHFHLIDTNVIFEKSVLTKYQTKENTSVRFADPHDQEQTVMLARRSFIFSRFHLDHNIPRDLANTVKAQWVKNYFTGQRGTHMVVAAIDDRIKGFAQLIQEDDLLTIDLIAVDIEARNRGIAGDMIAFAECHCRGIKRLRAGTQMANFPSIRFYEKMGFKMTETFYVFHYHSL